MKRPNLEMLLYTLIALGLCVLLGSTFTQAKSTSQVEQQPTATPESYFIEPPYNPCKDPYLQYERSEEGKQRYQQCNKRGKQ